MPWMGVDPETGIGPKIPKNYFKLRNMVRRSRRAARKSAKPARFNKSKATYEQTRAVSRVLKNISETKIQELTPKNDINPIAVEAPPGLGPCYFTNYCLGTAPSAWTGPSGAASFNDLNGFVWPQGTGTAQRVGQYLYLKRSTLNFRVAMNPQSRHGATKFRMIVYKEKRNRYNVPGNGNPNQDLFIDRTGNAVGVNSSAAVEQRAMDFSTWLVNKRNYQVVKDFKFVLNNETLSAQGSTDPFTVNQHHRAEKIIKLSLGHYQKAKFSGANVPEDQMYRYCITLISMPVSTSVSPHDGYSTYVNGVVSAVDN